MGELSKSAGCSPISANLLAKKEANTSVVAPYNEIVALDR